MHIPSRALIALLLGALLGCERSEPAAPASTGTPAPAWIDLARGYRPPPLEELARSLEARVQPPRAVRFVPVTDARTGAELWLELSLDRSGWTRGDDEITWSRPFPSGGAMLAAEITSYVVRDGETELKQGRPRQAKTGRFWDESDRLYVTQPAGEPPSEGLVLRVRLDAGREVDGHWRVAQWDLACDGFLLFPGSPQVLEVDVPANARLSFASVAPNPRGKGAELAPTTFRVLLDGKALLDEPQPCERPSRARFHAFDLGPAGRRKLTFEVEGPAPALIATPRIGPRSFGSPGRRPWDDARPDIVLVLCDTFRADNLSAWGGRPELAPHLDRFVEHTLHFLGARSAAAWTLPSIASILSGVFPGQHGATDMDRGVSSRVETIAEVLGRAGYRTAAQTDSGLFSRHYRQDQGFQWFEEALVQDWNLNATLARARQQMGADDGRPLFLVVHTYRVHGPMRVGPDEDIGPLMELRKLVRERTIERQASDAGVGKADVALEFLEEGKAMYESAVQDLDTKVGTWLEELERDGFFERGNLVFTADHGNSHGEHEQIGHGGDLYDIKLRVPLAIAGRGITPSAVPGPVSLIDVAPTIAALAGVAPSPTWFGHSLLAPHPPVPLYAFDLRAKNKQVALYADGRKLVAKDPEALSSGDDLFAFDLGADPAEDHNLAGKTGWPAALGKDLAGELEPLLVPLSKDEAVQIPAEMLDQLKAIGYGGGDDE